MRAAECSTVNVRLSENERTRSEQLETFLIWTTRRTNWLQQLCSVAGFIANTVCVKCVCVCGS